jgi:hypothetical protein
MFEPHAAVFSARHIHTCRFAHSHEFIESRLLIPILKQLYECLKQTEHKKLSNEQTEVGSVGPRHHYQRYKSGEVVMKDPPRFDVGAIHPQNILAQTQRNIVIEKPHLKEKFEETHMRKDKELNQRPQ